MTGTPPGFSSLIAVANSALAASRNIEFEIFEYLSSRQLDLTQQFFLMIQDYIIGLPLLLKLVI